MVVSGHLEADPIAVDEVAAGNPAPGATWRGLIDHGSIQAHFAVRRAGQQLAAAADCHLGRAFHGKRDLVRIVARRDREVVMTARGKLGRILKLIAPGLIENMAIAALADEVKPH